MRMSTRPAVRFHGMPHTAARPSARVVTISVFDPLVKVPVGPSAGSRKLTVAPSIGLPVSPVTSTVIPRVARDPVAYTASSPSRMRIWRMVGSCAAAPITPISRTITTRQVTRVSAWRREILSGQSMRKFGGLVHARQPAPTSRNRPSTPPDCRSLVSCRPRHAMQ